MPDVRRELATQERRRGEAEPALLRAAERFYEAWIVDNAYDEAFASFLPESYACVNLDLALAQQPTDDPREQARRLRDGLADFGAFLGDVRALEDVLEPVVPWDTRLRIVDHARSDAFAMLAVPNWVGERSSCEARLARDDDAAPAGEDGEYGRIYASAIRTDTRAGQPAVLYLGWIKEAASWRIFTYKVVDP